MAKTSDVYGIINKSYNRSPDSDTLSKYPDIEIIRRDENAIDKSIPHDIPADIELIPMSPDEMKLISIFKKRAPKRPFSPENMHSKLTKPNDYASTSSTVTAAFAAHDTNHISYLETSTITQSKTMTTTPSGNQAKKFHTNDSARTSGSGSAGVGHNSSNTITMAYNTKLEPPVTSMSVGDARIVPLSRAVSSTRSTFVFQTHRSKSPGTEQTDKSDTQSKSSDDERNGMKFSDVVDTVVENSRFGHLSSTVNDHLYQHQASFVVVSTDDSSDYSNEQLESDLLERLENNAITVTKSTIQTSTTTTSNPTHATAPSPIQHPMRHIQHFSADQFSNYINVNSTEEIIDENSDSCVEHEMLSPDNAAKSPTTDGTSETITTPDGIYKIQNFEGVLQMQPNSLLLDQEIEQNVEHHSPQRSFSQMTIDEDGNNLIIGRSMTVCDESSNSTAALADCSGDNSADTAVEELEPTIQNLDLIEDDPIEQKFTDAENYVLESGEISGDSGGKRTFTFCMRTY